MVIDHQIVRYLYCLLLKVNIISVGGVKMKDILLILNRSLINLCRRQRIYMLGYARYQTDSCLIKHMRNDYSYGASGQNNILMPAVLVFTHTLLFAKSKGCRN